ncbi:MAG: hypothetical protein HOP19_04260 [Acidobacteria bacterium]|nr:hypothetical protein [Acidobacteriota bacterium]
MQLLRESTNSLVTFSAHTLLGTGGEAQIHALPQASHLAAKIYHEPKDEYARKLALMLAHPPFSDDDHQTRAAIVWPVELLRQPDHGKQIVGFLMPRLHAMRPLMDFYNPRARRLAAPLFTYQYLHRTARNLAAAVSRLHERGYVIGDVNESNVLVSETALVTLVDTDSFQVRDPQTNAVYRCPVGKPEFTPPELVHTRFADLDRTVEHDRFGLAVLLFQILMEGTHPYSSVYAGAGEPPPLEARISAGHFSYDVARSAIYRPMPTAPAFTTLAPALQRLFQQAFVTGHGQPQYRPTAQAWADALHAAEQTLVTCAHNAQHRYGNHLSACPWCERTRLLNGRDPFPSPAAIQRGEHLRKAVRKSTVMALPPSPYYQTHAAAHRSYGTAYGTASRVVYASSAPPVVPMTAYLNTLNAPPATGRARWLILLQRAMAGVLALSFLFLGLGRFGAQSFAPPTKTPPPSARDAGAYWKQLLAPDLKVRGFSHAATGQTYALVTNDRWMTLWDLPSGNRTQTFTNYSNEHFTAAAYSPDRNLIVTGGTHPVLSFWDVATGTQRLTLNAHKGTISTLVFSPDGQTLASGSADSDVRLWEVKTGELIAGFDSHLSFVLALAFSPNGHTLASAGAEPTIQLYDRKKDGKWENTRSLLNSPTHVIALAFSPDGQTLAAANLAGEILLWDLRQGALRATWSLSREIAYGLAFSPNGEWLACGGSGGNVSVWSLDGKLHFERHGHESAVRALAFSPNGAQLISADVGTKFWQLPSGEIREAGNVAVQYWQMTEGEKQQLVHLTPYWKPLKKSECEVSRTHVGLVLIRTLSGLRGGRSQ